MLAAITNSRFNLIEIVVYNDYSEKMFTLLFQFQLQLY